MAVKEAKINKYTELLEEGLSYFGTFFLGLILGVLCEASTILNPTVIIILVIGILALAISAVAVILPVAMGANISGVITSAIAAGIFVTTIGMV